MNKLFCVVDIELTEEKEIIQFSATKLDQNFKELESINYYIKPKKQVSPFVTELTGINNLASSTVSKDILAWYLIPTSWNLFFKIT